MITNACLNEGLFVHRDSSALEKQNYHSPEERLPGIVASFGTIQRFPSPNMG